MWRLSKNFGWEQRYSTLSPTPAFFKFSPDFCKFYSMKCVLDKIFQKIPKFEIWEAQNSQKIQDIVLPDRKLPASRQECLAHWEKSFLCRPLFLSLCDHLSWNKQFYWEMNMIQGKNSLKGFGCLSWFCCCFLCAIQNNSWICKYSGCNKLSYLTSCFRMAIWLINRIANGISIAICNSIRTFWLTTTWWCATLFRLYIKYTTHIHTHGMKEKKRKWQYEMVSVRWFV